ncbi:MAG: hypothetical protein IBJ15_03485 [Alphaproteobacteria bacterium]|nr:hypothetical protein [Alphaproteobacteria bacterium]
MEILGWATGNPTILWALVGVGFLLIELAMPGGFFLSFALAGFLTALAAYAGWIGGGIVPLLVFAILGAATILPLRRLLAGFRPQVKDINDY